MARRLVMSAQGLRISQPGYDSATAPEPNVSFSTTRRQLMQLGSGVIQALGNPTRVWFGFDVGAAPLVLATVVGNANSIGEPVIVHVDQTGFYAYPLPRPDGSYPALGKTCSWVAFMLPRPA